MFEYLLPVLSWEKAAEMGRFVLVGGTTAVVYYSLFLLFTRGFRLHYQVAASLGFLPAFFLNFYLQKTWTFAAVCGIAWQEQLLYFSEKKRIFYFLNMLCLYVLIERIRLRSWIAQGILVPGLGIPGFFIVRWILTC